MEANFLNLKKKHDEYLSLTMYFQLSKIYHKFLRGDFLINNIPIRRSLFTKMRIIFGKTPKKNKNSWNILIASAGDSMVIDEVLSDVERFLPEKNCA